jgi:polyhydroxybutyrate depolymerase
MKRPLKNAGLSMLHTVYVVLIGIIVLIGVYLYKNYSYRGADIQAQVFNYPDQYQAASECKNMPASSADHKLMRSKQNIRYSVTTPANYHTDYAHPLLMVWAPSGFNEKLTERFAGLTGRATEKGYIVVHVQSVRLGMRSLGELAAIPAQVMASWCVSANHIFYTGHSDGGTIANALAVMPGLSVAPSVIAPSAMGMQGKDMASYECPAPTNVMLMHNRGDNHFPDYGAGVVRWWATCNQCSRPRQSSEYPYCVEYSECTEGGRTLFCQAEGNHAYWPAFDHRIMEFFGSTKKNPLY